MDCSLVTPLKRLEKYLEWRMISVSYWTLMRTNQKPKKDKTLMGVKQGPKLKRVKTNIKIEKMKSKNICMKNNFWRECKGNFIIRRCNLTLIIFRWNSKPNFRPKNYTDLEYLPVILIVVEKGKMGITYPRNASIYDLRSRWVSVLSIF